MTPGARRHRIVRLLAALTTGVALFGPWPGAPHATPVHAANAIVGSGSAGTCTPGAVQNAVDLVQSTGGGTITFQCGGAPHTIVMTATLTITSSVNFDGGALGDITLSRGGL